LTRAYHADRGEARAKVLTPDTSHGTNPASVTMAGYEVVKVATDERGGVDLDDLRSKVDDRVACLMLTNPNTLGVFDENIAEITQLVRDAGGTLYYDGANLNAIMGHTRPGDMGFDIVHVNLHKSFSQPHGGGGPGAGPIAVSDRIEPYLPVPRLVRAESADGATPAFDFDHERPKSIGRLRGFAGNFRVFVRSYAYITSLGGDGLTEASETAVLNPNYLLARLRAGRGAKYLPVAFARLCRPASSPPGRGGGQRPARRPPAALSGGGALGEASAQGDRPPRDAGRPAGQRRSGGGAGEAALEPPPALAPAQLGGAQLEQG